MNGTLIVRHNERWGTFLLAKFTVEEKLKAVKRYLDDIFDEYEGITFFY